MYFPPDIFCPFGVWKNVGWKNISKKEGICLIFSENYVILRR